MAFLSSCNNVCTLCVCVLPLVALTGANSGGGHEGAAALGQPGQVPRHRRRARHKTQHAKQTTGAEASIFNTILIYTLLYLHSLFRGAVLYYISILPPPPPPPHRKGMAAKTGSGRAHRKVPGIKRQRWRFSAGAVHCAV